MSRNFKVKNIAAVAVAIAILTAAGSASAQMDNRPFSFRNSTGGSGMSPGGKQAIIGEKILGETPDNLQRGPDGRLLDVTRGPGNSAITSLPGDGGYIPGYRGSGFRNGMSSMEAGVFNSYFMPLYSGGVSSSYSDIQTATVIESWIANVLPAGATYSYLDAGNSVNSWTAFVNNLNRF